MYKALVAKEFKNDNSIVIENHSLEELRKGLNDTNFIVQVHYSPINPLDLNKLLGNIFTLKCPFTPGSEASGIITESKRKDLIGKKVVFSSMAGTWKEYALATEEHSIFLPDNVDLSAAACGLINPLTCVGLVYQAEKYNAKGIVNLAAQSAIGRMINDYARERGLNCLNVIRGNAERVNTIKKEYQSEYVITLDQDNQAFLKEFKELAEKLSATVAFDPISGVLSGQILNNLPQNGVLINYGTLTGKEIDGINAVQLRWGNKRLEGFNCYFWLQSVPAADVESSKALVSKKLNTIFKTEIVSQFSLQDSKTALAQFRELKGGKKILFKIIQ